MYKKLSQYFCLIALMTSVSHSATKNNQEGAINQCVNKFAFCESTDCKMKGSSQATCECPIHLGKNFSTKSCQELKNPPPGKVYSTYSPRNLLASGGQGLAAKKIFEPTSFCHVGAASGTQSYQYADCFNVLCSAHGTHATCECPVVTTSQGSKESFFLQSNNCEEAVQFCQNYGQSGSKLVANSAPMALGGLMIQTSLKSYGQHINKDMFCTPKDKLRILEQGTGLDALTKKVKDKTQDVKIIHLPDHKRVKVEHTQSGRKEIYCVDGCDIPEDCRGSEGLPELGFKWVCDNKQGACTGKCYQKPISETSSQKQQDLNQPTIDKTSEINEQSLINKSDKPKMNDPIK